MLSILDLEENLESSILSIRKTVFDLKNKITIITGHENEINNKLEILNNRDTSITERENKLSILERQYNEKLLQLDLREKQIEKEQEDGRKVSILKNIQVQLTQKTSECELLNKQLKIYKLRSELINNICNKYNLNTDQLTLDMIEESILLKNKDTKMVFINSEPNAIQNDTNNTNVFNFDQPVEPVLESNVSKESELTVEEPTIEQEPDVEYGIEVDNFEYKGKSFYIDYKTGDIYAKLEDDEVGDIIGYRTEKGIVKFGLRKK